MTYMEVENHDDFYTFETDGRVIVSDSTGTSIIYDVAFDDLRYGSITCMVCMSHGFPSATKMPTDLGKYIMYLLNRSSCMCNDEMISDNSMVSVVHTWARFQLPIGCH